MIKLFSGHEAAHGGRAIVWGPHAARPVGVGLVVRLVALQLLDSPLVRLGGLVRLERLLRNEVPAAGEAKVLAVRRKILIQLHPGMERRKVR